MWTGQNKKTYSVPFSLSLLNRGHLRTRADSLGTWPHHQPSHNQRTYTLPCWHFWPPPSIRVPCSWWWWWWWKHAFVLAVHARTFNDVRTVPRVGLCPGPAVLGEQNRAHYTLNDSRCRQRRHGLFCVRLCDARVCVFVMCVHKNINK